MMSEIAMKYMSISGTFKFWVSYLPPIPKLVTPVFIFM